MIKGILKFPFNTTINVTIAVAVSVMMKATVNVIVATAPVDNKSDPESSYKIARVIANYIISTLTDSNKV